MTAATPWGPDFAALEASDPDIARIVLAERDRLNAGLQLIASENFTSPSVLAALGSTLSNKYAEGYPGKRYYGGCEVVDEAEVLGIERAKALFDADPIGRQRSVLIAAALVLADLCHSAGSVEVELDAWGVRIAKGLGGVPTPGKRTVAAILRARLSLPWSAARALCERGKVTVGGPSDASSSGNSSRACGASDTCAATPSKWPNASVSTSPINRCTPARAISR